MRDIDNGLEKVCIKSDLLPKVVSRASSIEISLGRVHEEGICAYKGKDIVQLKGNETTH